MVLPLCNEKKKLKLLRNPNRITVSKIPQKSTRHKIFYKSNTSLIFIRRMQTELHLPTDNLTTSSDRHLQSQHTE